LLVSEKRNKISEIATEQERGEAERRGETVIEMMGPVKVKW